MRDILFPLTSFCSMESTENTGLGIEIKHGSAHDGLSSLWGHQAHEDEEGRVDEQGFRRPVSTKQNDDTFRD